MEAVLAVALTLTSAAVVVLLFYVKRMQDALAEEQQRHADHVASLHETIATVRNLLNRAVGLLSEEVTSIGKTSISFSSTNPQQELRAFEVARNKRVDGMRRFLTDKDLAR